MTEESQTSNEIPRYARNDKTMIMAVLNITPDSFSDGGQFYTDVLAGGDFTQSVDNILLSAQLALESGADVLDIGGESTRPGAVEITIDEELCRVLPVIKALKQVFPQAVLSIDTRKSEVARQAVAAGASIINDVSGLQWDTQMAAVAASTGAQLVIMHSQGTPDIMQQHPGYPRGVVNELLEFFKTQTAEAIDSGVKKENIWIDPGFGFGKTLDHNLELLARLAEFKSLGFPILVGTSRKSFLTLGKPDDIPPAQRDALTAASLATAIANGANMVRVHNVPALAPVIRLADRIYKESTNSPVTPAKAGVQQPVIG